MKNDATLMPKAVGIPRSGLGQCRSVAPPSHGVKALLDKVLPDISLARFSVCPRDADPAVVESRFRVGAQVCC